MCDILLSKIYTDKAISSSTSRVDRLNILTKTPTFNYAIIYMCYLLSLG